jgi:hypothetical protein
VEAPLAAVLAADPSGAIDVSIFAQYGILGILALILIFFARGAHQRERDRADRMEQENQRLHELIIDRVIPALGSATRAAEEAADLLAAMQREREFAALAARRRDLEGGP